MVAATTAIGVNDMRILPVCTLCVLSVLLQAPATASVLFTTLTDPIFAERLPGPDGFLGTADDIATPGVNLGGTATYVEFRDVSPAAGTDFHSFGTGSFQIDQPLVASGGQVLVTDFSISLTNEQTNGLSSTSSDVPVQPHQLLFEFPGVIQADYMLRTELSLGTLEADLSLAGFTLLPGVDPTLLPGIDSATAAYLEFLTTIAPSGWSAITITVSPSTAITSQNTRGSLAPFFIGGTASGVTVLATTDSLDANPTPTPTPPATPTPTPTPIPHAPLDKDQQKCVNEMNKNGEKVNKAQLKDIEKCLKDYQKGKLTTSFEMCTTADRKGKVRTAQDKAITGEDKKCAPLAVPPHFAYTDATTVNQSAVDGALALSYAIFGGPPVQDADLATKASDKDTAKCQLQMLKQASKLENTVLKEINKAKKQAIKLESVDSASALETVLSAVLNWNEKITKTESKLVQKVDRKCAWLSVMPDTVFPGACADARSG